jgi:hypothetical protein
MGDEPIGSLGGGGKIVEVDETYIGNVGDVRQPRRFRSKDGRRAHGKGARPVKRCIVSLVERNGKVRSFHVGEVTNKNLREVLFSQIDNLFVSAAYQLDLGPGKLKLHSSFAEFAKSRRFDERPGYVRPAVADPYETFGERRYAADAQYHLSLGDRLQSIVGFEYRLDDIGTTSPVATTSCKPQVVRILPVIHQFVAVSPSIHDTRRGCPIRRATSTSTPTGVLQLRAAVRCRHEHSVGHLQTSTNNGQADTYETLIPTDASKTFPSRRERTPGSSRARIGEESDSYPSRTTKHRICSDG